MAIPAAAIGLPTTGGTVTAATVVAASGTGATAIPEHCLVAGSIAPVDSAATPILFKLALPTQWNSKVVMFGGGGLNGTIPNIAGNVPAGPFNMATPLGRGYATFASDSGHQANALGSLDGRFGANDEAVANFGGEALKKTRDASLFLLKARYAVSKAEKSYFAGGSTGGREALQAIQQWPADWDGAIVLFPAWNNLSAWIAGHRISKALAQPGAYPNQAKRALLTKAALQACDALDGVNDNLISDQKRCNAVFDPSTAMVGGAPLACVGGGDAGDTCLSAAQIDALKLIDRGASFNFALASGETGYPGANVWGSDLGINNPAYPAVSPTVTFLGLGTSQPVSPMPLTAPYISQMLDQLIKFMVTRDPTYDSLAFDSENPGAYLPRLSDLSARFDGKTDISAFVARGGKLLLAHGKSDVLVTTRTSELYYQRLQTQLGAEKVNSFARYYEVPGYGHAVSTAFNLSWDSLTTMEQWVEQGVAPTGQVATDTLGVPGRTRPMCDYPKWPKYNGTGDVNLAASFSCADPTAVPAPT